MSPLNIGHLASCQEWKQWEIYIFASEKNISTFSFCRATPVNTRSSSSGTSGRRTWASCSPSCTPGRWRWIRTGSTRSSERQRCCRSKACWTILCENNAKKLLLWVFRYLDGKWNVTCNVFQTSLSNNEQREADDYSPLAKRIRTGALSPSLLPCRDTSADSVTRHNGDRDPWARPMSPKLEHGLVESSSHHKYEHTNGSGGDNKSNSLLSQALLEKSGSRDEREDTRDSVSDDDSSERGAGSASIDTIKSDREMRDCEPPTTPIFPPGLEALYRQAGFPPFLGLGGPSGHPQAPQAPTVTHVGLQSHAANPTGKQVKYLASVSLWREFITSSTQFQLKFLKGKIKVYSKGIQVTSG